MALQIAQDDPIGQLIDKQVMLPPGSNDVDGTALVMLPGGWLRVDLSALAAANDIVAVQNPFGVDVLISHAVIRIKTAGGTATAVINVDVVDGATDTGDDIFDGVDANATAVISSFAAGAGTNAEHTSWLWEKAGGTNDHLSSKLLVEAAAALVAYLYVQIIPTE